MIEIYGFQINLFAIFISLILIILLCLKKTDLLSILAFTSPLYNLVLFNYKPWTFGFQIFFFFAIIFIFLSFKNFVINLKNKNNLILLTPVFIFIFVIILGEIFAYFVQPPILVVRPPDNGPMIEREIFKFSRLNITQILYIIFYLMIFLCIIFQDKLELLKIFKFYLFGLNFNLLFQLLDFFYLKSESRLPTFLINLSFFQETVQRIILKNIEFYRLSGLLPTPSLLGIYLFVGFLILIFFKEYFSKKFLFFEFFILSLSGLMSLSVTFLLSLFVIFLMLLLQKRNFLFLILSLLFLVLLIYISSNKLSTNLRIENAIFSLKIFLRYPILGIGIGSHFSFDLLTTLLATTGALGFLSFISIFTIPLIKSLQIKNESLLNLMKLTLLHLILILLIWHGFNVNIFWLILGMWYNKLKQCFG